MSKDLIPTEENPHPLLKLRGVERRNFAIKSILITTIVTVGLYLFPSYYGLEKLTTATSYFFLDIFGFHPRIFTYEDSFSDLSGFDNFIMGLYDSSRATYPAISIDSGYSRSNYLIVRACTGMQAGSLLLGLIWATPAEFHDKVRSSYIMLIALFIGNTLRIAAMIAITTILIENFGLEYETAWGYAHDWMGRPLGFFGTIAFTILIEVRGVKILDTITTWIDFLSSLVLGEKEIAESVTKKE
jgi:exosortase/archaeosortase family protein